MIHFCTFRNPSNRIVPKFYLKTKKKFPKNLQCKHYVNHNINTHGKGNGRKQELTIELGSFIFFILCSHCVKNSFQ